MGKLCLFQSYDRKATACSQVTGRFSIRVQTLYFLLHANREGHDIRIFETSNPWKADFRTIKIRPWLHG